MNENVISKIKKLLSLSENAGAEPAEAESAALMAQKLMANHGISSQDVDFILQEEEIINTSGYNCGVGKAWKYRLATIIADNFRCKHYIQGRRIIVFYGRETDAAAAKGVFAYLFKIGHLLADREAHRAFHKTGKTAGVYNSFVLGFMVGIKVKLDEQCRALMLVIDEKVVAEYEIFSKGFGTINHRQLVTSDEIM